MTDAGWDPAGEVLVVGHSIDPDVLGDIRRRLPDTMVHVLDLAESDSDGIEDEGLEGHGDEDDDSGFPPDSDRAVESITGALGENPGITTLLAQSRWAARDIWRIVRPQPQLLGFTHLDNLERARSQSLVIDVSPYGRRRNSHRFSAEFAGDDAAWKPGVRARVLVGPENHHGRAAGWARALCSLGGVDAMSLSVGDDGFPSEVMATTADWDTRTVRRGLLELAASATHLLLDDGATPIAAELRSACTGRVVDARERDLPVAVRAVPAPDRVDAAHAVVIGGDGEDVPGPWRVTCLDEIPAGLWVTTAVTADLVVDQRELPTLDVPVVSALAQGAVLVAGLGRPGWLRRPVPHLPSLSHPTLADPITLFRLRAETAAYAAERHGDAVVARKLRRVLGLR